MDIHASHNPFCLQGEYWTIHCPKTFYEWLIWGSQMFAGTHVLSSTAPHHQPGTIVSTGNKAMDTLDTVPRYINSILPIFTLPAQRASDTWEQHTVGRHSAECGSLNMKQPPQTREFEHLFPSCWYCSGRLWNLYKIKLCWRKYFTRGQTWGFITWTCFLFSLWFLAARLTSWHAMLLCLTCHNGLHPLWSRKPH